LIFERLPYAPPPCTDEVLSSWIERIGIFYGIGLVGARTVLTPTVSPSEWARNEDIDTCGEIRQLASAWTGRNKSSSPAVWSASDLSMLEVSARLTYCPKCWDEDAADGRPPYIRRAWARWSCVSCPSHKNWLAARTPGIGAGCALNGWTVIWQSQPNWAQAAGVPFDPNGRVSARSFAPESLQRPECRWADFERELASLSTMDENACSGAFPVDSAVATVVRPELIALRTQTVRALHVNEPPVLISDLDLRGYSRLEPGWICMRIACLVMALEITRLAAGRPPMLRSVRAIIEPLHRR
jgi:hypothetical protein